MLTSCVFNDMILPVCLGRYFNMKEHWIKPELIAAGTSKPGSTFSFDSPEATYAPSPVQPEANFAPPMQPEASFAPLPVQPEANFAPPVQPEACFAPPVQPEANFAPSVQPDNF
jgi:hypothetical protein